MNETYYVAYGSNLNLEQMAQRCPTAALVGPATLHNRRLVFRGSHAGAVATVEPCRGSSVPVLIWRITPADEAALDRYEGWPYLYRKETIKVRLDGETVSGMIYIMNKGRPHGSPSCYYYSVILDGYNSAGFDVQTLKKAARESAEAAENE